MFGPGLLWDSAPPFGGTRTTLKKDRSMHALRVAAFALSISVLACLDAAAQSYPVKPSRIIIPAAPGGNPDFIARPVTQKMSQSLKQPLLIVNRPVAAGIIGAEQAARTAPDGYTILFAAIGHVATASALQRKIPFDINKDLAPISLVAAVPFALFVHPSVPAQTVAELIARAKARAGQVTYASFGVGSFAHFAAEALGAAGGISMHHIPYKGSASASNR